MFVTTFPINWHFSLLHATHEPRNVSVSASCSLIPFCFMLWHLECWASIWSSYCFLYFLYGFANVFIICKFSILLYIYVLQCLPWGEYIFLKTELNLTHVSFGSVKVGTCIDPCGIPLVIILIFDTLYTSWMITNYSILMFSNIGPSQKIEWCREMLMSLLLLVHIAFSSVYRSIFASERLLSFSQTMSPTESI